MTRDEIIKFLKDNWWWIWIAVYMLICACKQNMTRKEYYRSGRIRTVSPYKNGVIHGTVVEYYENGKIKIKEDY